MACLFPALMRSTCRQTPRSVLKLTISLLSRIFLTNIKKLLAFINDYKWERFLVVKTSSNLGFRLLYPCPISKPFPSAPESQYFMQMCKHSFVLFFWFCFTLNTTQDLAKFETFTKQRARCASHPLIRSRHAPDINLVAENPRYGVVAA